MKINYICRDPGAVPDGRGIYDKSLVKGFQENGHDVRTFFIRERGRRFPLGPLWSLKVDAWSLPAIDRQAFTILSHESIFACAEAIRPDLLIAHNYPPAFVWPESALFQSAYRWGALAEFRQACRFSKALLLLSERERRLAQGQLDVEVFAEPPGLRPLSGPCLKADLNLIRRSGSTDWYPKRRSLIKGRELNNLASSVPGARVEDSSDARGFMLIEDQFLSGFKLKLIDGIFRGDFVLSRVDLSDEIQWLGLDLKGYRTVADWSKTDLRALQGSFSQELDDEFVSRRANGLYASFAWDQIAQRIAEKLH